MTPTVHNEGPYQFIFYSSDRPEPPHIHVRRDRDEAKFWLEPVELAYNDRFAQHELNRIEKLVRKNRAKLLGAWHDHFRS